MTDAPLTTTENLKAGDVVMINAEYQNRKTGAHYWDIRFAVVTHVWARHTFDALTLKLSPDTIKDLRTTDLRDIDKMGRRRVVTLLREPWPQGVSAIWTKLLTLRYFDVGGE